MSVDQMMDRVEIYLRRIRDPDLRRGVRHYIVDKWQAFSLDPYSVHFHHSYTGGLFDHTLEVVKIGLSLVYYLKRTFGAAVDPGHYIAAALLHDLGRVGYHVQDPETGEWRRTELRELRERRGPVHALQVVLDYPRVTGLKLPRPVEFAILSHMGGWSRTGVYPDTLLAAILHAADLISSRLKGTLKEEP